MTRIDSTGAAAVDYQYFWRRIDSSAPIGVKLQLISASSGVATYGQLGTAESYFTHWAPLPKFDPATFDPYDNRDDMR